MLDADCAGDGSPPLYQLGYNGPKFPFLTANLIADRLPKQFIPNSNVKIFTYKYVINYVKFTYIEEVLRSFTARNA